MATKKENVGRRVTLHWGPFDVIATITGISDTYPATAYRVRIHGTEDNPHIQSARARIVHRDEPLPPDCIGWEREELTDGADSVAHFSQVAE